MMGRKICFNGEIWTITPKLSLLPLLIWSTVDSVWYACRDIMCYYMYLQLSHVSLLIQVTVKVGKTLREGLTKAMKLRELDPDDCEVFDRRTRYDNLL